MKTIELACGKLQINAAGSSFRCTVKTAAVSRGVERVKVTLHSAKAAALPRTELLLETPLRSAAYCWFPDGHTRRILLPEWNAHQHSDMTCCSPQFTVFDGNARNILSCAVSECERYVDFHCGVKEEDNHLYTTFILFSKPEASCRSAEFELYCDSRSVYYADAMRGVTDFFAEYYPPAPVPAAARRPLYSSWYSFHQDLFDKELEAELAEASRQGLKCVIVDDGWQTEDNHRGYAFCGDWEPAEKRFPNIVKHVRAVHRLGMKYMFWFSVPFVGYKSRNHARFKGKYLYDIDTLQTSVLDPRFPEVREFLCGIYEKAVGEWGADGLKLDFIDCFSRCTDDPAVKEDYAGRDTKSIPEGVNRLFSAITRRLNAIKPGVLIEFRQSYVGPAIRQHGNMFRASDCPADVLSNRERIIDLRLSCGDSAVHGDMLTFAQDTPAAEAALQLLAVLFAVPQISVRYGKTTPAQRKMLAHYTSFMEDHIALLQKGKLRPMHPELIYPAVSTSRGKETLTAVYAQHFAVELGKTPRNYLVNATPAKKLTVKLHQAARFVAFDCTGEPCAEGKLPAGLQEVAIPPAGMLELF